MGDWCVVTWRDCTWWMGVFISTPPPLTLRRGRAHAAAICPMWAMWRGLRYVGGGPSTWLGIWWQGVLLAPPSTDWGVQERTIRPRCVAWRSLTISKLNFKHTYSIEITFYNKDNLLRLMFAYTTSDVYLTLMFNFEIYSIYFREITI